MTDLITPTKAQHIALRFNPRDAKALRNLADRARTSDIRDISDGNATTIFELAAGAADTGEPLIIACTNPTEAVLLAQAFPRYGIAAPVIEQISGRPDAPRGLPTPGGHPRPH